MDIWHRNVGYLSFGSSLRGIAVDSQGNVIVGGQRTNDPTIPTRSLVKYSHDGDVIWYNNDRVTVWSIVVDESDNIYVGGSGGVSKYDADGNALWSNSFTETTEIDIDPSGNIFAAGGAGGIRKINASGGSVWTIALGPGTDIANGVACDGSGFVYACGRQTIPAVQTVAKKFDTGGNQVWQSILTFPPGRVPGPIDVNNAGTVVYVGSGSSNDLDGTNLYQLDSSGGVSWGVNAYGSVTSLRVREDDSVYVTTGLNSQYVNTTTVSGSGTANEVQRVRHVGVPPTGGTFGILRSSVTVSGVPWNCTASELQSALESFATIGAGNVSCTGGPLPGAPIDIEYVGALANTNVVPFGLIHEDLEGVAQVFLYDSSGSQVWEFNHRQIAEDITFDSSGQVYICGALCERFE